MLLQLELNIAWKYSWGIEFTCTFSHKRLLFFLLSGKRGQNTCSWNGKNAGGLKNSKIELIWGRSHSVNYLMLWADERESRKQGLLQISCCPQIHNWFLQSISAIKMTCSKILSYRRMQKFFFSPQKRSKNGIPFSINGFLHPPSLFSAKAVQVVAATRKIKKFLNITNSLILIDYMIFWSIDFQ